MTFSDLNLEFKLTLNTSETLYLQWPTNIIYRTAPFSMTLNDPYARF